VSQPPRAPTRRLFFALWPTQDERGALGAAAAEAVRVSGGRAVPEANLHVTLAFLGSVPEARVTELAALGRALAGAWPRADTPLMLRFTALEQWAKPQLLCAVAEPSLQATALSVGLKRAARGAGFSPDLKPFRAHVTLARAVASAAAHAPLARVIWERGALALIASHTTAAGSVYSVLESSLLGEC
jgi:2'-5' RNA ligase